MLAAAMVGLGCACGDTLCDDCDTPIGECAAAGAPFYPLEPGAWWRDEVIDPGTSMAECPDKLVSIDREGDIVSEGDPHTPLRPGVTAFVAHSDRENALGRRWQSVRADGIYREVDEWFIPLEDGTPGDRSKIVFYCPRALRVPDGALACEGRRITEQYFIGTLTAATPEDWPDCVGSAVDAETCEPVVSHPNCLMQRKEATSEWTIEAVDEPIETALGEHSAMRVRQVLRIKGELDDTQVQWWARGVGKLKESHEPAESETLVDLCLPTEGCERPAPTRDELKAACGE